MVFILTFQRFLIIDKCPGTYAQVPDFKRHSSNLSFNERTNITPSNALCWATCEQIVQTETFKAGNVNILKG